MKETFLQSWENYFKSKGNYLIIMINAQLNKKN